MTIHCHPLPRPIIEDILQVVARAVCDRPGESSAQCASRTEQLVHTTLGFEPRDGLEYMLATLAFGHFYTILDSMHDVFKGQAAGMKTRTKSGIVALDRYLMNFVRELREEQTRPVARYALAPAVPADAPASVAAAVPTDLPADVPATVAMEPPPFVHRETPVATASSEAISALSGLTPAAAAWLAGDGPVQMPLASLAVEPSAAVTAADGKPAAGDPNRAPAASRVQFPPVLKLAEPGGEPEASLRNEPDGTFEEHLAAFRDALAACNETIEEAKASQRVRAEAGTGVPTTGLVPRDPA